MKKIQKILIDIVVYIKKIFHLKTYVVEYIFVGIILFTIALISGKGIVEWVGVLAVLINFGHTQIADRLKEKEEKRFKNNEMVNVDCYWKLNYYFYAKELCWLLYFFLVGAWSALAGVFIFLLYPLWRKTWRK